MVVVHTCSPSIQEAEAGSLSGLHSEFKSKLNYIVRPCLKATKTVDRKLVCEVEVYIKPKYPECWKVAK